MIEIREATPDDTDSLLVLEDHMNRKLRSFYRLSAFGHANYERRLKAQPNLPNKYTILVATKNQTVVGTIQYHAENSLLHLFGLSVHEDFRRQGYAREIMNYLINFAKEQKLTTIRFNTMQITGNVQIFQRIGFSILSEKPSVLCEGLNGEPIVDVQMEKQIFYATL